MEIFKVKQLVKGHIDAEKQGQDVDYSWRNTAQEKTRKGTKRNCIECQD